MMTVLGVATWPDFMAGIESESTESSAIATASPFRLERRTKEPEGSPLGVETIPGLARGAP